METDSSDYNGGTECIHMTKKKQNKATSSPRKCHQQGYQNRHQVHSIKYRLYSFFYSYLVYVDKASSVCLYSGSCCLIEDTTELKSHLWIHHNYKRKRMGSGDTAADDGGRSGTPTQKEKKETQGSGKKPPFRSANPNKRNTVPRHTSSKENVMT